MKAHWTTFEGKEQFEVLRKKASQLGSVYRQMHEAAYFGYDADYNKYVAYRISDNTKEDEEYYYQDATYLPYTEYLDYLDNCIAERHV